MAGGPDSFRVMILADKSKRQVNEALNELRPWLRRRAHIVAEPDAARLGAEAVAELPEADLALVLGGDGTLLAQARNLLERGIPLLGVNFGKLGFLAEFSIEDLRGCWDQIAAGRCPTCDRLVLDVLVFDAESADCQVGKLDVEHLKRRSIAVNDAVITAGPPFRMIELGLTISPFDHRARATRFAGDGVIIATPAGSTAYNTSAGGPILGPGVEALCITPICAHSLAFRPVVVSAASGIAIRVSTANDGTTLVLDGQSSLTLATEEQVFVCRHQRKVRLVENPRQDYWQTLARKMQWAVRPTKG